MHDVLIDMSPVAPLRLQTASQLPVSPCHLNSTGCRVFSTPSGDEDIENNTVAGNITVVGLQSCWFGALRNTVRGNMFVIGDTMGDSDANEVVNNNIDGGMACFGNDVPIQYGDSGATPNIVSRFARGQCGFNVLSPDVDLPPGTPQPISVKASHHAHS